MTTEIRTADQLARGHGLESDQAKRIERVRWYSANVFLALFAGGLLDQVALPSVAAGVESTGRVRFMPWARATRTAASEQIAFWGDDADRRAEMDRLKLLHRDVKGLGYNGVRYSALSPESWNWIMISTFFMHRNAYAPITGARLTAADNQAFWDFYREETDHLQLPGAARLPESYTDLCAYYDSIVAEKAQANKTLDGAVETLRRPPFPDFLPSAAKPVWPIISLIGGHVAVILGFGIVHPGIRELTNVKWTRRHQIEFQILSKGVQIANRTLPRRLTYSPLAYNRWQYEKVVSQYRSVGLTSFAPDGCPVG